MGLMCPAPFFDAGDLALKSYFQAVLLSVCQNRLIFFRCYLPYYYGVNNATRVLELLNCIPVTWQQRQRGRLKKYGNSIIICSLP